MVEVHWLQILHILFVGFWLGYLVRGWVKRRWLKWMARRMAELKPCPFCGGEAILETVDGNSPEGEL